MKSILIKRGHIINPGENQDFVGDIYIKNGKIVEVGEDLFRRISQADEVIDANGLYCAPGLVDMHVHLRDPGYESKEDVFTACRAAAAGGVTSILAMPNSRPPLDSFETIDYLKKRSQKANAHVYFAGAITNRMAGRQTTNIEELKRAGIIALSDDGLPVSNTRCLLEALRESERLNLLVTAHCEDLSLAEGGIMNEGEVSKAIRIKGIPNVAEDCDTAREIAVAEAINARIHICHVSTAGSVRIIRDAKARGVRVTAETAPHYISFTDDCLVRKDSDFKMNPPLRSKADRAAIIEAVTNGVIDVIATDHAPHTPWEKQSFLTAPNGVIGMETSFAACMTELVHTGKMTLSGLIERMSVKPAEILGIEAGNIRVGQKADLMIFDKSERWVVNPDSLHGKSKNTPYKHMELIGRVKYTILAGKKVFDYRKKSER